MGFWDLVSKGFKYVGEQAKNFNDEVKNYENNFDNYTDEQLQRAFNSSSGARKVAIAKVLKKRGLIR